jgi:hypothetical protein
MARLHVSDASCLFIINRNDLIPLLRQGVQRLAFHRRDFFPRGPLERNWRARAQIPGCMKWSAART